MAAAGITLELGQRRSSRPSSGSRATAGPVAVLGSGVMGLSTARLVQEAGLPGHDLRRRAAARHDLEHRRRPVPPFRRLPRWRRHARFMAQFTRALDYSWRRFQIMVGDDYGIRWLPTYVETRQPRARLLADLPAGQPPAAAGRASVPGRARRPLRHALCRDRPLSAPDDPRRADRRRPDRGPRFRDAGRHRRLARSPRLQLHRPRQPRPVRRPGAAARRGQLAILEPQPEVQYAFTGGPGYMFPRPDGIFLGGTFELDQWDTTPDRRDRPDLARTSACSARFRCTA